MARVIKDLERNGMGWTWKFVGDDWYLYGTNDMGEGLFRVDLICNTRKQLLGTCDFSLPTDTAKARRKIIRWLHN